jgi:hypothetical protein
MREKVRAEYDIRGLIGVKISIAKVHESAKTRAFRVCNLKTKAEGEHGRTVGQMVGGFLKPLLADTPGLC